jgi:hypothetical protein
MVSSFGSTAWSGWCSSRQLRRARWVDQDLGMFFGVAQRGENALDNFGERATRRRGQLLGPAKLPPALVKRLNEELNTVLALPDVRDLFAKEGATARPGTPEEFGKLIRAELGRWNKLVKDAKIATE